MLGDLLGREGGGHGGVGYGRVCGDVGVDVDGEGWGRGTAWVGVVDGWPLGDVVV